MASIADFKSCIGLAFHTTAYNDCIISAMTEINDSANAYWKETSRKDAITLCVLIALVTATLWVVIGFLYLRVKFDRVQELERKTLEISLSSTGADIRMPPLACAELFSKQTSDEMWMTEIVDGTRWCLFKDAAPMDALRGVEMATTTKFKVSVRDKREEKGSTRAYLTDDGVAEKGCTFS